MFALINVMRKLYEREQMQKRMQYQKQLEEKKNGTI